MKNILIVEDHPLFQEVIVSVARDAFAGAAIEIAASLAEAIHKAREAGPDLVLLDLVLPDSGGMDTFRRFRRAQPGTRVVVVCEIEEPAYMVTALDGGAAGYVPKAMSRPVIFAALRLVAAGGIFVPPQAIDGGTKLAAQRRVDLTGRQRDVLRLIARGLPNKAIAHKLAIAEDTVKQHARAAYAMLGVSSRSEAVTAVTRRGLRLE